ncbi:MAG: hypothetical protein LBC97_11060 [Bifidobacteriaceae bacterium]|nr:hypothetical protein [Bifidobacteriaceae bacterium]
MNGRGDRWRAKTAVVVAEGAGAALVKVDIRDGVSCGWELWRITDDATVLVGVSSSMSRIAEAVESMGPFDGAAVLPKDSWRPVRLPARIVAAPNNAVIPPVPKGERPAKAGFKWGVPTAPRSRRSGGPR